jgi:hypothetical protein
MKDKDTEPSNTRRFSLFPKPLAQSLTQALKPAYKKHGFAEHRILTEWDRIVGSELAGYSLPQKLSQSRSRQEGGTLHLLVASGRALELQHMQPVIVSRIATYFGYAAVTRLAFTQVHSALFRKEEIKPPPPEPAADPDLIALAGQCEDERLRSALLSLGQALAAVEK